MSNSRRSRASGNDPATAVAVSASSGHGIPAWTAEEIRGLGASTDLRTAAQIFGLSPNTAYALARRGDFPVPVIRAGNQYRVPVAPILAALHLDVDPKPPAGPPPTTRATT